MGCVTLVDDQLARIIEKLKELGLYENTLIVISSDHGDYLGDHFMMQKGFFHDCSSKIPLILHGPDIPAGQRLAELASQADLMPTLLDYCGLIYRPRDDGTGTYFETERTPGIAESISLLPWINCGKGDAERMLLCESGIQGLSIMLRQGNQKFNYYDDTGSVDCFDLETDPNELDDQGQNFPDKNALPKKFYDNLNTVLATLEPHRQKEYFFKGKFRPMFT